MLYIIDRWESGTKFASTVTAKNLDEAIQVPPPAGEYSYNNIFFLSMIEEGEQLKFAGTIHGAREYKED